jgi:hypothetical protein
MKDRFPFSLVAAITACLIAMLLSPSAMMSQAYYDSHDAWKIRGKAISATAPTNGQVLVYSSTTRQWVPGAGGGGSYTAGATGALTITGSVIDVDTAYVPNKTGSQTITGPWTFYDSTAGTGSTLLTVRAGAGQSGDIQAWKNNAGTTVARITQEGYASFGGSSGMELRGDTSQLFVTDIGTSRNIFSFRDYLSLGISSDTLLGWSNGTNATGTLDIGVGRCGAGCLEVNSGTSGTLRDIKSRLQIGTQGADIASAGTIAPTDSTVRVTGTTLISTITVPSNCAVTNTTCQITLIPTGIFTTNTAGNIGLASTAVVGRALIMTYAHAQGKWYPSY